MCENFPAYRERLLETTSDAIVALEAAFASSDTDEVFKRLIVEPMCQVRQQREGENMVVVIDALDELPPAALRPVLNVLTRGFLLLPHFIRLFVTSRDQSDIERIFLPFRPRHLELSSQENKRDLRFYLSSLASAYVSSTVSPRAIERLVSLRYGVDLAGALETLEGALLRSRQCYELAAEDIKGGESAAYKSLCRIKEIRPETPLVQVLGEGEKEIHALFRDAAEARSILKNVIAGENWQEIPTASGSLLEVPVPGTALEWLDNVHVPGLKGLERSLEKVRLDYGGNLMLLKDVCRLSLVFSTCTRMLNSIDKLRTMGFNIVGLKNKYASPTPMGYRDFNVSIAVPLDDGRLHIGK